MIEKTIRAGGGAGGRGGWRIIRSIAGELDVALSALDEKAGLVLSGGPTALLVAALPADWRAQWRELGGAGGTASILEDVALAAGCFDADDYSAATLAMRELDVDGATAWASAQAARVGVEERESPNAGDPTAPGAAAASERTERLIELLVRTRIASYARFGVEVSETSTQIVRLRREWSFIVRLLKHGDLNSRFWHLLDRFYFEWYRPWRAERDAFVAQNEQRLLAALGAREGTGAPPLEWLPPQNPVVQFERLRRSIEAGELGLLFWIEPFGLADSLTLEADRVIVSIAQPSEAYDRFRGYAAEVAKRAAALGDPTRLTILRMIRNFSLMNTEIASYLGISRPTVSVHAKILRDAGLIRSRQEGHAVRHEIVPEEVHRFFDDLERLLDLPKE